MPKIEALSWLAGSWQGSLGPLNVEEVWMPPLAGSVQMMIRLTTPEGVEMSEILAIRETDTGSGFVLHLRQYSPELELRNGQDLVLDEIGEKTVSFVAGGDSHITNLSYELMAEDQLRVIVTNSGGEPMTADLQRS